MNQDTTAADHVQELCGCLCLCVQEHVGVHALCMTAHHFNTVPVISSLFIQSHSSVQ